MNRRTFMGTAALGVAGWEAARAADKPVRLGVVGTGGRGRGLMELALMLGGVQVPALCDINKENLAKAQETVATQLGNKPEGYTGAEDYARLVAREDLDAVIIATPWDLHTRIAVAAMRAGKYTGVEVPAALTIEECWQLVDTQEQTKTPCMMMENWSFRRDNLAVLRMIRAGLLGEINHCHCAHSHNCVYWYFNEDGTPRWSGQRLLGHNADQYPTHALGPVLSWMNLNCGDYPAFITSMTTRSLSVPAYYAKKFGAGSPAAKRAMKQGDIVTSLIKTIQGNTIVLNNDMQSPRPYDNRWEISGTNGVYNEQRTSVYIAGRSPKYEEWEPFAAYQKEFDHPWYQELDRKFGDNLNDPRAHGGPDFLEMQLFLRACRERGPLPIDIYDSVVMSAPVALSEKSIASGSQPVPFPDFTRGKWKNRKPYFAA